MMIFVGRFGVFYTGGQYENYVFSIASVSNFILRSSKGSAKILQVWSSFASSYISNSLKTWILLLGLNINFIKRASLLYCMASLLYGLEMLHKILVIKILWNHMFGIENSCKYIRIKFVWSPAEVSAKAGSWISCHTLQCPTESVSDYRLVNRQAGSSIREVGADEIESLETLIDDLFGAIPDFPKIRFMVLPGGCIGNDR